MKEEGFVVSVGPHIQCKESIQRMMYAFIIALIPAMLMGVYTFGISALKLLIVAVVSAVLVEAGLQRLMKKEITIKDGSAVLTGVLMALILPVTVPWWVVVVAIFTGLLVAKHVYGGLGSNPFNPVLVGWAAIKLSYPSYLDISNSVLGVTKLLGAHSLVQDYGYFAQNYGVQTWEGIGAKIQLFVNVLMQWKAVPIIGEQTCGIGEISAIALIIGAAFLLWKGYISWHIPAGFLGTVFIFSVLFGEKDFVYPYTLVQLLSGSTLLAAFFVATDPGTSPYNNVAMIIFGCLCGLVTMVGRLWGGWIEPVWFAVLVGNAFVPLIDRYTKPKVFGSGKGA